MDAIASVTDKVKRFIMTGTAKHLPVSAVAYTLLPQALLRLNVRLSTTPADRSRHERSLSFYSEIGRLCNLRHGVSFPTDCMHRLLRFFESSQAELFVPSTEFSSTTATSGCDMVYRYPAVYLRLAAILDHALSTGETLTEEESMLLFPFPGIGEKNFLLPRSLSPPASALRDKGSTATATATTTPAFRALELMNGSSGFTLDTFEQSPTSALAALAAQAPWESSMFRFDSDEEHFRTMNDNDDERDEGEEEDSRPRKRARRFEDILIELPLFGE
jgi:hypothetical protein